MNLLSDDGKASVILLRNYHANFFLRLLRSEVFAATFRSENSENIAAG